MNNPALPHRLDRGLPFGASNATDKSAEKKLSPLQSRATH
jgi:hypothetical protein